MFKCRYFSKLFSFLKEIYMINTADSICIIRKKHIKAEDGFTYFSFDVFGASLTITMRASEIAKNENLLNRFPLEQRDEIIFSSGLCSYYISSINMSDNEWIITLKAKFQDEILVKKFHINELVNNPIFLAKLNQKDKSVLEKIFLDNNIVLLSERRKMKNANSHREKINMNSTI